MNILTSNLLYDITFSTYMIGEGLSEELVRERYMIQSATDDERKGKICRFINSAWDKVMEQLSAYVEQLPTTDFDVDNSVDLPEKLSVTLSVNDAIPNHCIDAIANYIHSYIVNYVLWNWLVFTDKKDVDLYLDMCNRDMDSLRSVISMRSFLKNRGEWRLL